MYEHHHMLRQQTTVTVGTSSTQIAGPNPRRKGLVIGAPPVQADPGSAQTVIAHAVDTSTTGVKLSYTVPAGQSAVMTSAYMNETTGTTVIATLELKRGATVLGLQAITKNGVINGPIPLQAGDIIQWDVTFAVAASITEFAIGVSLDVGTTRITIGLWDTVVLDQGINLYPGTLPFAMWHHEYGDALHEAISAITQAGSISVTVVDFFG